MKEILLTSGVLIAVILLLRLILRKRVSKRLIYATWLLVAVRLLVPVQFGQFEYSVTSVAEKLEQQSTLIQQVQEDLQRPVAGPDQQVLYGQLVQQYLAQADASAAPSVTPEPTVPPEVQVQLRQEAQAAAITPAQLLNALWACGAVLTAGWFLITNLLFLRKARKNSVAFDQCSSPIPVRISPCVSTPCLAGLLRPTIYLTPESTADPQTLNHVLTHELTHLKHWDHIWVWVRCLCLCLYWFDPLVWIAAIASKRDCELACDEAALNKLGEDQRIAYGRTLLATVTHNSVRVFHTTTAMSESGKQLRERVNFIVKRPRNLWIAAICLILAATLTTALVFAGCKPQENSVPSPTVQPSTEATEPTAEPTGPREEQQTVYASTYDVLHNIPPLPEESPSEALEIARDAIERYLWYGLMGSCCDHTPITADLSQYLADAQKEEYSGQHKITCCQNAQQVRAHIDRYLSKELQNDGYPEDKLFRDGDGNLYIMILPTCYDAYRHVEVLSQTDSQIVARACSYDEDGCFRNTVFTLQSTDRGYQITKVWEDKDYRCEITVVDQGTNYKVLRYGTSYYGYELYGDDGYLRVRQTTEQYCPTVTRISGDVWEISVGYGPGVIQRTYWNTSDLRSEVYDYVIAVGYGKIAYLDGDLDNRVLVVCDIFNRTDADIHDYYSFAPEPMPVTEAAFTKSEEGNRCELTFTYYIGKVTQASDRISVWLTKKG